MHTIMVVLGGFLLLGVCLPRGAPGREADGHAALIFIPIWLRRPDQPLARRVPAPATRSPRSADLSCCFRDSRGRGTVHLVEFS